MELKKAGVSVSLWFINVRPLCYVDIGVQQKPIGNGDVSCVDVTLSDNGAVFEKPEDF